jgi:hypothetical protein
VSEKLLSLLYNTQYKRKYPNHKNIKYAFQDIGERIGIHVKIIPYSSRLDKEFLSSIFFLNKKAGTIAKHN